MRRIAAVVFLFCLSLMSAGAQVEIIDGKGRKVQIPKKPTAVTITPVATDFVFSVGAGDNLLAVSSFSPTHGRNLPQVGSVFGLDFEKVVALNPDVVISGLVSDDFIRARLERCGVKFVYLHGEGLDNIEKNIRLVGKIFGRDAEAGKIAADFVLRTKPVETKKPKRALFIFSSVAAGRGSYVSDLMSRCGFENCAEEANTQWPVLQREFVVKANPEVLFVAFMNPEDKAGALERLRSDIAWRATDAVIKNNIYFVDAADIILPSARVVNAVDTFMRAFRAK